MMYIAFLWKSFQKHAAYRSDIVLRLLIGIAWIGIQVAIWSALIGSGEIDGIDLPTMITYAVLNSVISLTLVDRALPEADQKIRSGDISIDLIKPYHYLVTVFADQMGRSFYVAVFTVTPTAVVAALTFDVQAPASIWHGAAFLLAMAIALLISFAFACIIILLAFYFLATFHFTWTFHALKSLFAGSLVPLWFYPDGLRQVAELLPFQFLGFVPAMIWIGQEPGRTIASVLSLGLFWSCALAATVAWLWRRIVSRLVVQGG
jgi:ABC-2 type transport system permease protein